MVDDLVIRIGDKGKHKVKDIKTNTKTKIGKVSSNLQIREGAGTRSSCLQAEEMQLARSELCPSSFVSMRMRMSIRMMMRMMMITMMLVMMMMMMMMMTDVLPHAGMDIDGRG